MTIREVFDAFSPDEKKAIYELVGQMFETGTINWGLYHKLLYGKLEYQKDVIDILLKEALKGEWIGCKRRVMTVREVFDTFSPDEKEAIYELLGQTIETGAINWGLYLKLIYGKLEYQKDVIDIFVKEALKGEK